MKKVLTLFAAISFCSGSLFALQHSFNSQKTTLDQLPAPAQKAIKAHAGNAAIQDIDMETFDGFTTYQVAFNKGANHKELRVDSQGKVWGEKWREIPAAVEKAADKAIGSNKLLGFRKQAIANNQQVYHFRYDRNGAPADLWLSAAGARVQAPAGADIIETAGANVTTAGQTVATPTTTTTTANPAAGAAGTGQLSGGNWIMFKDLPWPVQQTIMNQAAGANVQRVYKTERDGQTVYHARFQKEGQNTRVAVRQDGTLVNTITGAAATPIGVGETGDATLNQNTTQLQGGSKVSFNDLPQAVKNAITAQANGAAVEDVDKGTINGQTVYEAAFKKDGKTYELQVKEDGSVLGGHFD